MYFYGGYGCSFQCCFLAFRFSSCLLKQWCMAQIQGFILLVLREFPEVLFLSLVNNSENMGDGFARKPGFDPGLGRSPGEGNGNPLQYSYLENPMDRGAWQATVHRVAKSRTRLSNFTHSTHSLTQVLESLEASPSIALVNDVQLIQRHLEVLCCFSSFSLLPRSQDFNRSHGCTGGRR